MTSCIRLVWSCVVVRAHPVSLLCYPLTHCILSIHPSILPNKKQESANEAWRVSNRAKKKGTWFSVKYVYNVLEIKTEYILKLDFKIYKCKFVDVYDKFMLECLCTEFYFTYNSVCHSQKYFYFKPSLSNLEVIKPRPRGLLRRC